MSYRIAWSDLTIATRDKEGQSLLLRQFQFISDDLGDRIYEGSIGLRLSSKLSAKQYQSMALSRVLQHASMSQATVIINTEEELSALAPYMKLIVEGFSDKLNND
jgi:hypothetical protein